MNFFFLSSSRDSSGRNEECGKGVWGRVRGVETSTGLKVVYVGYV